MIRISELIKTLEELKDKHGDVPVLTKEDGFGGYAIHEAALPDDYELFISDFFEEGSNTEKAKEFFPEWNGEDNTIDDIKPITCVCMYTGSTIYST